MSIKFSDWFDKRLHVGAFPQDDFCFEDYDFCINVSDEFKPEIQMMSYVKGCHYFWFPMNEAKKDVGLNSIFGAMCILHHAETKGKTVYLHCHAGINRSQAVRAAYHYVRTAKHFNNEHGGYINSLIAMSARGYLPPKKELESFLSHISLNFNEEGLKYRGLDRVKIDTINNF